MGRSLCIAQDGNTIHVEIPCRGWITLLPRRDSGVAVCYSRRPGYTTWIEPAEARANVQSIEDWAVAHGHDGARGLTEFFFEARKHAVPRHVVGERDRDWIVAALVTLTITGVLPRLLIYAIGCLTSEK